MHADNNFNLTYILSYQTLMPLSGYIAIAEDLNLPDIKWNINCIVQDNNYTHAFALRTKFLDVAIYF